VHDVGPPPPRLYLVLVRFITDTSVQKTFRRWTSWRRLKRPPSMRYYRKCRKWGLFLSVGNPPSRTKHKGTWFFSTRVFPLTMTLYPHISAIYNSLKHIRFPNDRQWVIIDQDERWKRVCDYPDSDFCPCGAHAGQRKCMGGSSKGKQESMVSCSYEFSEINVHYWITF